MSVISELDKIDGQLQKISSHSDKIFEVVDLLENPDRWLQQHPALERLESIKQSAQGFLDLLPNEGDIESTLKDRSGALTEEVCGAAEGWVSAVGDVVLDGGAQLTEQFDRFVGFTEAIPEDLVAHLERGQQLVAAIRVNCIEQSSQKSAELENLIIEVFTQRVEERFAPFFQSMNQGLNVLPEGVDAHMSNIESMVDIADKAIGSVTADFEGAVDVLNDLLPALKTVKTMMGA